MPSTSRVIICAAGGGKTTGVVREALAEVHSRRALITYTQNNKQEIERQFFECCPIIPSRIEVMIWFAFLLHDLARPYRRVLHSHRIDGIQWIEGRSAKFTSRATPSKYYFSNEHLIYSDKISELICECDRLSGGAVMRRLRLRFDHVVIDEVQDLAGYDLEVVEMMLKAGVTVTVVGDHRQATFSTNNSPKNKAFAGVHIINKFREWEKRGLAALVYRYDTYRCNQEISDLADSFFPDEPRTNSLCSANTGHDGIFFVRRSDVDAYIKEYEPQVLRLNKRTNCHIIGAMNFGESKGRSFDRVIIFPHGLAQRWLETGDFQHVEGSRAKLYVGITRARNSVAFVFDGLGAIPNARIYEPAKSCRAVAGAGN
jgi:DNA helicase-2/ATP-dependent DNA helicase PcrA